MKKLVCLLLMLVMMLTVLSACKPKEHVHTFDEAWQSDETDHWHQATCEHAEEIADKAPHEDLDDNDLCDVCGYAMSHVHTYSDKWSFNKDEHYHAPTCGCNANDKKYQKDNAPHVDKDNDALCDVCGYDYDHTHVYDTEVWTKADETYHWHAPTCGHDVDGADKEEHKDEDNDGICDGCDWDYDHTHTYEDTWTTDGDYHWYKATCGHDVFGEKNPHRDQDNDGKCDQCSITPEHFHDMDWDVWSGDETNHWRAAKGDCVSCVDSQGNAIVADFGKHENWKEDGECDVCGYVVFHMYQIDVVLPDISSIVDAEGKPILGADGNPVVMPFTVKEGNTLEFYISVPGTHRLESVSGAEVDMINYIKLEQENGTDLYLYKITLTPVSDVTITVTISKLSSVEEVASGEGSFDVKDMSKHYFDISFTPEETGRYIILCIERDDINFGPKGNVPTMQNSYEFTATAGQTVYLQAMFSTINPKGTETFTYHILRVDEVFVLPYLEGEGFLLPAKVNTTFKFTLPEPGLYQFTTTLGDLVWVTDEDASGTVLPQFFLCTYAGQEFTHTGRYTDAQKGITYDFDWNIIKMNEAGALSMGENTVSVDTTKYTGYTFTAPATGYYSFTNGEGLRLNILGNVNSNGIATMSGYGGSENLLLAGQTIRLYTSADTSGATKPTGNFSTSLKITYDGYTPRVDSQGVTLHPGASYQFAAEEDGYYTFRVDGEGAFFRVDGGAWTQELNKALKDGASVKLEVRSDSSSAVKIYISSVPFKHTVSTGAAKYTFHPNVKYAVTLTGGVSPKPQQSYVLTWSDVNLTVKYNGTAIKSGVEFAYTPDTALTVIYKGTAANDIQLKLEDKYEAPPANMTLNEGDNNVALIGGAFGREMIFTALKADTYTLRLIDGETNGKIVIGDKTYTAENLPVELKLTQGEELHMMVYTVNGVSDTVNLSIDCKNTQPDEPEQPDTPDVPDVPDVPNDSELFGVFYTDYEKYELKFIGNTLTITDKTGSNPRYPKYEYTFIRDDMTVTLYDEQGDVPQSYSIRYYPAGWALVVAGQSEPYILHEDKDDIKKSSEEMLIGQNAVYVRGQGTELMFTAPQDGTYVLSTAPGEKNAFIVIETGWDGHVFFIAQLVIEGSGTYSIYLTEGQTVGYAVSASDGSEDTIDLTFVRKEGTPHYHTYSDAWTSDGTSHWHQATCAGHSDRYTGKASHMDENKDGDCDVCGRTYRTVYKVSLNLPEGSILQNMKGEQITSLILNPSGDTATLECYLLIPNMYDSDTIQILIDGVKLNLKDNNEAKDYWTLDTTQPGYWKVYLHKENVKKNVTLTVSAQSPERLAEVIEAAHNVTVDFTGKQIGDTVSFKITFQAKTAGYYYISGNSGLRISAVNNGVAASDLLVYAKANSTVTVYGVAAYDGGEITQHFSYSVKKSGTYQLPSLSGAGLKLSSGTPSVVTLTLPEDGLYYFAAGNYQWTLNGTVYNKQDFYYKAKAGDTITLQVDKIFGENEKKTDTYVLTWNVERVDDTAALEVGVNTVQPAVGDYTVYTFTAQIAGDYLFKLEDGTMANLYTYNKGMVDHAGDRYLWMNLDAGQTVRVYLYGVQERDEDGNLVENQQPTSDTMTVVALGHNVQRNEDGKYVANTGVINSFLSNGNAMYKVTVSGGQMTLDGKNWINGIEELVLEKDETLCFMVKSATNAATVLVSIERISFTADFVQGDNTLNLRPGVEYEINVKDLSKFALLWDANLDITVTTAGGVPVANGENTTESQLYVLYNGEAAAEITFQVADRALVVVPDAWVEGSNSLTLRPGVEYEVSVSGLSKYALSWDASHDVTVRAGDESIANGASASASVLYIVYNGGEEAEICFQLADREPVIVSDVWSEGRNGLTLAPGKNYVITLPDWAYGAGLYGYKLTWNHANVEMYHGDLPSNDTQIGTGSEFPANVVSGVLHFSDSQTLTIVNTGDAAITVIFDLEKPMMTLGDNVIVDETYLWAESSLIFTAAETGVYTFTATDVLWINDGSGTVELAAGETHTIVMIAGQRATIDLDSSEEEVVINITMA